MVNGSVQVCGHDVIKDGCAARKKIGYVIQNFDFHPYTPFTVEEVVLMGRYGKIGWLETSFQQGHGQGHIGNKPAGPEPDAKEPDRKTLRRTAAKGA